MKKNIHPDWHRDAVVTCACGNSFKTGSTRKTIEVEICSACHPFFTGEMKFVDTQGRVDKFQKKMIKAQSKQATQIKKGKSKDEDSAENRSYKDILREQKSVIRKQSKTQAVARAPA